jgi:hypothetical protein
MYLFNHADICLKQQKYHYARTQNLFKEAPRTLARYIREGISWIDNQAADPAPCDIRSIYENLWGVSPQITLPFEQTLKGNTIEAEEILRTITEEDIKQRIRKLKKKTAPGLDGVEVRHLQGSDPTIVLRYLFNILLISSLQPTEWRINHKTLIPKPGKDPSRAENHRPLTIGSLISRIYWGIIDQRLREKATFSPRQKGFVSEAGCFNNVHILKEIIRFAKSNEGLIGIQLDVSKAFDTIPHEAIGPALR